jgi:hypothetical protein
MKTISILSLSVILFSCNNPTTQSYKHSVPDTVLVDAIFRYNNYDYLGLIVRLTRDSLKYKTQSDSSTLKKEWVRDTAYFVQINDKIPDSLRKNKNDSIASHYDPVKAIKDFGKN